MKQDTRSGDAKFKVGDRVIIDSVGEGTIEEVLLDRNYYLYRCGSRWVCEDKLRKCQESDTEEANSCTEENGKQTTDRPSESMNGGKFSIGDIVVYSDQNISGKVIGYLPEYAGGSYEVEIPDGRVFVFMESALDLVKARQDEEKSDSFVMTDSDLRALLKGAYEDGMHEKSDLDFKNAYGFMCDYIEKELGIGLSMMEKNIIWYRMKVAMSK